MRLIDVDLLEKQMDTTIQKMHIPTACVPGDLRKYGGCGRYCGR